MKMMQHWVVLTPVKIVVGGKALDHKETGAALVAELYKEQVGDYPKFYKMDPLSKAGFVASELLLKAEKADRTEWGESRAVVLFNATSSLADDKKYQETIDNPEDFYPSPSFFVYTLPNVLTGEIAIRNRYYGESNFMVLDKADADTMAAAIAYAFQDEATESVLTGWADCEGENNFDVRLFIADRAMAADREELAKEINNLLNI